LNNKTIITYISLIYQVQDKADIIMKKALFTILITFLFALTSAAKKHKELYILHSNDTHSCILPMNPNLADTVIAGKGGFLRRITMIAQERKLHPNLLYIDSGDFSQGSSYYTLFKGEVEIGLMNMMNLDATTLGNHEWDYGMDRLAEILKTANFPVVCSNYTFTDTPLEGIIKPWIVTKRNGIKIGIFAVCPKLEGLVDLKKCEGVEYLNPFECAAETATVLKKQEKCDIIICISHLGWGQNGDIKLVNSTRYIDLVLGGHSHTNFKQLEYVKDLDGRDVPVNQNGKSGLTIGSLKLTLSK